MKSKLIPEAWLRCMSPADRKRIGQMTGEEAIVAFSNRKEKELHKLIYSELTRRGVVAIHSAMHKRSTNNKGTPDFLFAIGGQPYAIEVKTDVGAVSAEQIRMLAQMQDGRNGWSTHIVRSFEDFLEVVGWR